jgi:hypothetical protein
VGGGWGGGGGGGGDWRPVTFSIFLPPRARGGGSGPGRA